MSIGITENLFEDKWLQETGYTRKGQPLLVCRIYQPGAACPKGSLVLATRDPTVRLRQRVVLMSQIYHAGT